MGHGEARQRRWVEMLQIRLTSAAAQGNVHLELQMRLYTKAMKENFHHIRKLRTCNIPSEDMQQLISAWLCLLVNLLEV